MTIPDAPDQIATWLEKHLVGLRLTALVAELSAAHGSNAISTGSIRELLGPRFSTVLQSGLRELPVETLRQLLKQPTLMFELQEAVLTEGGRYWDSLAAKSNELDDLIAGGGRRVAELAPPLASPSTMQVRTSWYAKPWAVSFVTASTVLLAVLIVNRALRMPVELPDQFTPGEVAKSNPNPKPQEEPKPKPPEVVQASWGWFRPEALPAKVPASEYLEKLASAAEEWTKVRPANASALAKRLGEFRQGCSVLLLANHKPLPASERTWLQARCKAGAARIDRHLTDLESGRLVSEILEQADETSRQIATALRFHAEGIRI